MTKKPKSSSAIKRTALSDADLAAANGGLICGGVCVAVGTALTVAAIGGYVYSIFEPYYGGSRTGGGGSGSGSGSGSGGGGGTSSSMITYDQN